MKNRFATGVVVGLLVFGNGSLFDSKQHGCQNLSKMAYVCATARDRGISQESIKNYINGKVSKEKYNMAVIQINDIYNHSEISPDQIGIHTFSECMKIK